MASSSRISRRSESARTQAEEDYGTGARKLPPQLHEMSPASQDAVRGGFTNSMSNWKSREQAMIDNGAKSALGQNTVDRLTDTTVDIPTASKNMAGAWDRMMDAPDKPDSAWYFGHNRRITEVANQHGMDPNKVISASAAMSPQNGPDNEFRAVSAMADAKANGRKVTAVNDVTDKDGGVVMKAGSSRKLSSMSPQDMQHVTGASNKKNIKVAEGFDVAGYRSGGTNRKEGVKTLNDPDYNAVDNMSTAKVKLYDQAIRESKPDTPLHAEYEARFGDQAAARGVRQGREADAAAGKTGPETLRGVPDRVDMYGLMGRGSDNNPSDPMHDHPILGSRGTAVPDTWVSGILSGQQMHDTPESSSPAKLAGSQTKSTSSSAKGSTFRSPANVPEGGKKLTGNAAWGMAAVDAIQGAATMAREPESQTNIPPVMMQEMTWTHERSQVAKSTMESASSTKAGKAAMRAAGLTSGTLAGEKEFRPNNGLHGPLEPNNSAAPGLFHRGSNDPLDTDTMRVVPGNSGRSPSPSLSGRSSHLDAFHNRAASGAPNEMDKRGAIMSALDARRR